MTNTSSTDSLERLVAQALRSSLGPVEVRDAVRLTGGASRETWKVTTTPPLQHLIVRRDPPGRPSPAGTTAHEAAAMGAARSAGVPVPEVMFWSEDPAALGTSGMVMPFVDGEALPQRLLGDRSFDDARRELTAQCGAALAALHSVDPDTIDSLDEDDPLEVLRERLDGYIAERTADPVPTFEYALRWLRENRPEPSGRSIVHGDFRMGNLMVDHDGLAAVLDWELVHIGDPVEDLGWLCARAWRFGSALAVGGIGTREELLDAYVAAGGVAVDPATLRWWEVLATLRWGVICQTQSSVHLRGELASVELAAIGRRVCETEWDLLLLLAPEAVAAARRPSTWRVAAGAATAPVGDLHGRPGAAELLDAVASFLREEVVDATSGATSFQVRVAAHTLRIVRRELELGDAQRSERRSALAELGFVDEVDFAHALRDGAVAAEPLDDTTAAMLIDGVAARLAVSSPRYADDS